MSDESLNQILFLKLNSFQKIFFYMYYYNFSINNFFNDGTTVLCFPFNVQVSSKVL